MPNNNFRCSSILLVRNFARTQVDNCLLYMAYRGHSVILSRWIVWSGRSKMASVTGPVPWQEMTGFSCDWWPERLYVASVAWPSQGSWTSYMVTIVSQSEYCKSNRQKLMSFCDRLSEFIELLLPFHWSKQPWAYPDSKGEKTSSLDGGVSW